MLLSAAETVPADWHRLADYLRAQGMSFDPEQPIRQFAGGLANRNYLVVVDGVRAVLRRPPDGDLPPGAHDMAREHRILSRLATALPFIAPSLHYCERRDLIGVPFQLIEYRSGIATAKSLAHHPRVQLDDLTAAGVAEVQRRKGHRSLAYLLWHGN